jgi:hypothetical protein
MSLILTDRDGHFIGVEKQGKSILLKHRHLDTKEQPDWDDLYFTTKEAKILLNKMLNKRYTRIFKREPNKLFGNLEGEKEFIIGATSKRGECIETTAVEIYWVKDKKCERNPEFQMHYSTSWIGMGEREAKELHEQLKEALKGKK